MTDPILRRREQIRSQAGRAQRVGYLLFGLATVLFFFGLFTEFTDGLVRTIIGLMIVASIVLAVAIQVGYAIRGAERHEEDSIAQRRRR